MELTSLNRWPGNQGNPPSSDGCDEREKYGCNSGELVRAGDDKGQHKPPPIHPAQRRVFLFQESAMSIDIPIPAPGAGQKAFDEAESAVRDCIRRGYTIKCDAHRWRFIAMKGRTA